jgi:hypothetical protein
MKLFQQICLFILISAVMLLTEAQAQNASSEQMYSKGDTLEIVIPRVFSQEDIGQAYVKSVTGLQGERIVNGSLSTISDTSDQTLLYKFTDGLVLNAWGTGTGMYSKGLSVDTDIRRAQLTIMKITMSDKLAEPVSSEYYEKEANPLLLVGIDYGYSFNLSISGPKSRFTNGVYQQLKEAIDRENPINSIIRKYDLDATFAPRGIRSKSGYREIPVNWQDLTEKYDLGEPTTVFGCYLLLKDLGAQSIIWLD